MRVFTRIVARETENLQNEPRNLVTGKIRRLEAEEVDEVVRSCFGFRLPFFGPFQIGDMVGLDVYRSVLGILKDCLGERFEAPEALRDLVERGRTGTKSGAGFLTYSGEERERLLTERDRRYAALNELLDRLPPVEAGAGGRS